MSDNPPNLNLKELYAKKKKIIIKKGYSVAWSFWMCVKVITYGSELFHINIWCSAHFSRHALISLTQRLQIDKNTTRMNLKSFKHTSSYSTQM